MIARRIALLVSLACAALSAQFTSSSEQASPDATDHQDRAVSRGGATTRSQLIMSERRVRRWVSPSHCRECHRLRRGTIGNRPRGNSHPPTLRSLCPALLGTHVLNGAIYSLHTTCEGFRADGPSGYNRELIVAKKAKPPNRPA
jgi:hypothetical protein